jgi:hypothetical protein
MHMSNALFGTALVLYTIVLLNLPAVVGSGLKHFLGDQHAHAHVNHGLLGLTFIGLVVIALLQTSIIHDFGNSFSTSIVVRQNETPVKAAAPTPLRPTHHRVGHVSSAPRPLKWRKQ